MNWLRTGRPVPVAAVLSLALAACSDPGSGNGPGVVFTGQDSSDQSSQVDAPPGLDTYPFDSVGPLDGEVAPPDADDDASPPPDQIGPPNTAPTFDAPPPVTLKQGASTTLDLNPFIADAEDADAALVITWSPDHVALADPGGHVIDIVAPTDWFGVEVISLTVTDTGGSTASADLTVTVEESTIEPPPDDCDQVTFSYAASSAVSEVMLAGSFNGWEPTTALEDPDGDNTWEVTITLDPGTYEYKFVVDGAWIADPANPNTVDDTFGGLNSVIEVCAGEPPPPPVGECGEVSFSYNGPGAGEVLLSGSFNGWAPSAAEGAWALEDPEGDGLWEITVTVDPGVYQYKYIVDGAWLADPSNPNTADDGQGGLNSVIEVPDCPDPGELYLVSHQTGAASFDATLATIDESAITLDAVTVTVDWEAAPAGAVTLGADGTTVDIALTGLADGIYDVRVEKGEQLLILKVYIGLDSDWRDALIYFAMTDRFKNGDPSNDAPVPGVDPRTNYQGGDFAGITAKIEEGYFDELGVGAIWISWPLDNPDGYEDGTHIDQDGCQLDPKTAASSPAKYTGFHGYWPSDLYATDEHFGTLDELKELVSKAHEHKIRVLLDYTANHVHDSSPFFAEHADDGYFNYPDDLCEDVGWNKVCWFTKYLPDLDYNHPGARQAVIDMGVWWAKQSGADGFRFDAVKHLEMSFIEQLRATTKAELELTGIDFYIVGETFDGNASFIAEFMGPDKVHGQFDFPANVVIIEAFARQDKGLDEMDTAVRSAKASYGNALMSNFIGNHDVARFISHAAGHITCGAWDVQSNIAQGWRNPPGQPSELAPYQKLQLAFTYIYTIPGLPLIYYGDEFGLPGAGDPDNRRMMRFGAELSTLEGDTLAFMNKLGQVRRDHKVLARGAWSQPLWSEGDLLAYARTSGGEAGVVIINAGAGSRSGSLDVGAGGVGDGALTDVLGSGGSATVTGGQLAFDVPARSAQIFVTGGP